MTAAKYDLNIDQGSDFEISIVIEEDGAVKNLAGYGARAQMREHTEATTAYDFDTTGSLFDSSGTVKIAMAHTITDDIPAGIYFYDLEIFHTGNDTVTRILQGKATVSREVTR